MDDRKQISGPISREDYSTIFMIDIVRRWPSVEKINIITIIIITIIIQGSDHGKIH